MKGKQRLLGWLLLLLPPLWAAWGESPAPLLLFALPAALPLLRAVQRRRERVQFESELLRAIPLFIAALRAGHGLLQCLELGARRRGLFAGELAVVIERWRGGQPLPEILAQRQALHNSREYRLFCSALIVGWQSGGGLCLIFESLEETLTQRQLLREKTSAQTAQARAQAWLVSLLAPGFLLALSWLDPSFTAPLYHTRPGQELLALVAILTALGIIGVQRMSTPPET